MAKLTLPLLSQTAHGQIAKKLVYCKRNSGNQVRYFHQPTKEPTLQQWTRRHIIGLLTAQWQCKTDVEKAVFNDYVKNHNLCMSGFNYFVHLATGDLLTYHGLCGYWSMNEEGSQVLDYSGNANHGNLLPTYPSNCPIRVDSFRKEYGKALSFDGTNDYVSCGSNSILQLADKFSIGMWFYSNGTQVAYTTLIRSYAAGSDINYGIYLSNNSLYGHISNGTSGANTPLINMSAKHLRWNYVVFVNNNKSLGIYVDGVASAFNSTTITPQQSGTLLRIGYEKGGTRYFNGLIDDVRIYNRALSASEIVKQYNLFRFNKKRQ